MHVADIGHGASRSRPISLTRTTPERLGLLDVLYDKWPGMPALRPVVAAHALSRASATRFGRQRTGLGAWSSASGWGRGGWRGRVRAALSFAYHGACWCCAPRRRVEQAAAPAEVEVVASSGRRLLDPALHVASTKV